MSDEQVRTGFVRCTAEDLLEPEAVEEGVYTLTVVKWDDQWVSSKGNPGYKAVLRIENPPIANADTVKTWLMEPSDEDEDDARTAKTRRLKRFLITLGRDINAEVAADGGFSTTSDSVEGRSGDFMLDVDTDEEGQRRNNLIIKAA